MSYIISYWYARKQKHKFSFLNSKTYMECSNYPLSVMFANPMPLLVYFLFSAHKQAHLAIACHYLSGSEMKVLQFLKSGNMVGVSELLLKFSVADYNSLLGCWFVCKHASMQHAFSCWLTRQRCTEEVILVYLYWMRRCRTILKPPSKRTCSI